ncbi:hypothetical protein E4U41_002551 [Claviceps citrina]|nr:hypothetical protein E4U41_002551 [Claviceps citrina]
MHLSASLVASALAVGASAGSNYLGFNSGATLPDRSAKFKKDFEAEFKTAQGLVNAPGTFNSVRLYTNIQAYSQDDPIQAFEAAIDTRTNLLLGVWASGSDNIDRELTALKKAVSTYGSKFTDLVIGISIGSEDLYRDSVTGRKNKGGIGNSPDNIVKFINDFKKAFADSPLGKVPCGHVDTWDAWTNSSVKAVIDAVDFVGVDEYPYYENGKGNDIKNSGRLFDHAFDITAAAVNGKPVWVTETGWPSIGPNWDQAVSSVENAKYYWDEVGCRKLFNKVPTFWYNLRDSNPDNKMKFAITKDLSTTPLFDLSCPKTFDTKPETNGASGTGAAKSTASGNDKSTSTGAAAPDSSASSGPDGSSGNGGSDGGSSTTPSAAATTTKDSSSAASLGKLSGAACFALALVAGVVALF